MSPACHVCGAVITPDSSPAGLCPACLLAQALGHPGDDLDAAEEGAESPGLAPGSRFGPFTIEAILGRGGMSTVYRAHETALDRVVAVKVLPPEFLHDETFAKRFQQEARVVAALEHPHIVPLYATGIEGGIAWMSMRLMAGGNLAALVTSGRLDQWRVREARDLYAKRAAEILRAIASALDYAHARGVVHRDVKPTNILLDRDGRVCLSDFGLAHLMERSLVQTRTGVIAGTPHYMAPEQGLGRPVDHRADIYSLGVVAYEMLTGRPPYEADSPLAILMKHVNEPFPAPTKERVPEAMVPVLRKALAKEPADRWPSATAFANAVAESIAAPSRGMRAVSSVAVWAMGSAAVAVIGVLVLLPRPMPMEPTPLSTVEAPPVSETPEKPVSEVVPPGPSQARLPIAEIGPPAPARARAPTVSAQRVPAPPPPSQSVPVQPAPVQGMAQTVPSAESTRTIAPGAPPSERPAVGQSESVPVPAGGDTRGQAPTPSNGAAIANPDPVTPQRTEDTIIQPVRVRTVNATYPPLALVAQIEGDVLLRAVVGPDGRVSEAVVVRSVHPLLDDAARKAVLQYSYRPGLRNGVPATFRVQVTVSFMIK